MSADNAFSSWEAAVSWLRCQPDQSQLVLDCYFDDPLLGAAERYWRSEEWRAVRASLAGRSGKALDLGAGRGIASYALARDGFEVTALEPDPSALVGGAAIRSLADSAHMPIHVVEEYSEVLPFPDRTFDLVFARAVLHHARDLAATCRETFRVLKPGGLFMAIREHVISNEADLPRFLDQHPLHRLYGGEHAYLLDRYVAAISEAGLSNLEVISAWRSPINYAPYNLHTLQAELARRAGGGIAGLERLLQAGLRIPGIWPLLRGVLESVDRRPGRLHSFVALRT